MRRKLGTGGVHPDRGFTRRFGGLVGGRPNRSHHGAVLRRLHRNNGIAGVSGALEPPGTLGAHDIAQLAHAQKRRNPRHQVLAEGGRRAEDVGVVGREFADLGRGDRRQGKLVRLMIDPDDGGHSRKRGCLCRHGAAVGGEHCDVDGRWLEASGAGYALRGAGIEALPVMLGNDQHPGHQTSSLFRSAFTSPATSLTVTPPGRWAGGSMPNT